LQKRAESLDRRKDPKSKEAGLRHEAPKGAYRCNSIDPMTRDLSVAKYTIIYAKINNRNRATLRAKEPLKSFNLTGCRCSRLSEIGDTAVHPEGTQPGRKLGRQRKLVGKFGALNRRTT
jgi:hypothetical protein